MGTPAGTDSSFQRLVDWNVTIFEELLEEIVAHRGIMTTVSSASSSPNTTALIESVSPKGTHVRDEVVETITMPAYNAASTNQSYRGGDGSAKLNPKAVSQLRDYVTKIASYYHADNGFHNFQHASHVIMSTVKLLQRIATPDVKKRDCETDKDYFNYTFGISHDPLTKFAIVFSALIHDVDHQGVSNFQLAKEKDSMAIAYENKSVLEQHSFDLAWSLLTESKYKDLRNAIYSTQEEYDRFRQLSVNCVLATDIFDKDMKSFRDSRWERLSNRIAAATTTTTPLPASTITRIGTARQRLLSNASSKHRTWHIPCNIGMYTRDGIYACLRKCIRPLWRDGPIRIRPWVGTMVNYGSLIITSSR